MKLAVLLGWLQRLANEYNGLKSLEPSNYLRQSLELGYLTAIKKVNLKVEQKHCDDVANIFPSLTSSTKAECTHLIPEEAVAAPIEESVEVAVIATEED